MMLHHADAIPLLATLPERSADLLLTDPPYCTTAAVWDDECPLLLWWSLAWRVATNPTIVFSTQPFTTDLINIGRGQFRHEIIWAKTRAVGHLDAQRRPLRAHENVLVFGRRPVAYQPQKMDSGRPIGRAVIRTTHRRNSSLWRCHAKGTVWADDGTRYPTDVFLAGKDADGKGHPCSKPVALLEWLIASYSKPGDLVVDPFMGSGSTGVACLRTGRRFLGIERDAAYYALARQRIAAAMDE